MSYYRKNYSYISKPWNNKGYTNKNFNEWNSITQGSNVVNKRWIRYP